MTLETAMGALAVIVTIAWAAWMGWLAWTGRLLMRPEESGSELQRAATVVVPGAACGIVILAGGLALSRATESFVVLVATVLLSLSWLAIGFIAMLTGRPGWLVPPPLRPWIGTLRQYRTSRRP